MNNVETNPLPAENRAVNSPRPRLSFNGIAWIRRIIAPPVFEDEETTRIARLLNYILLGNLSVAVLAFLILAIVGPSRVIGLSITIFLSAPFLMLWFLMRRGHVRLLSYLFLILLEIFAIVLSVFAGGMVGLTMTFLILIILIAGLLLGGKEALIFLGISFVTSAGLAYAESLQVLPPPIAPMPLVFRLVINYTYFILAGLLLFLSDGSIRKALNQSRQKALELSLEIIERQDIEKKLQNYSKELEISNDELNEAQFVLKRKSQELEQMNETLEQRVANRTQEIEQVNQLGLVLQSCQSYDEVYRAVELSLPQLFPEDLAELYVFQSSKNKLGGVANSEGAPNTKTFFPQECWSLRMGKPHHYDPQGKEMRCAHTEGSANTNTLCVSMIAESEILGVFHIAMPSEKSEESREQQTRLVQALANRIAMAISNLRLQETLRAQAIRDPMTGLYNRRYMEEAITRDLARAQRRAQKVAMLMLDIDHFKNFNDSYGHAAGDGVLQEIGQILMKNLRGEDIPCRYGGEEFVIIMPEAKLRDGVARAEVLGSEIRQLTLMHDGQYMGGVTVSVGVAIYPDHGEDAKQVLKAADQALYQAKDNGRDCVVVFE